MTQETINQRLNFLIENLGLSIRAFSATLGVSDTNTRNYLTKGTKPNSDYLESLLRHFNRVNPAWLLLGEGEPFLSTDPPSSTNLNAKKISRSQVIATNQGKAAMSASDCEKDLAAAQKEIESLKEQLTSKDTVIAAKDALIAAKDETISLLRGGYNRPN